MQKSCPDHGELRDIVFSDVELYLKMEEWNFGDNLGLSNPQVEGAKACPDDCGLCGNGNFLTPEATSGHGRRAGASAGETPTVLISAQRCTPSDSHLRCHALSRFSRR